MRIEYHPKLEIELREIIKYYNTCTNGLGIKFLNEFEQSVLNIASNPYQWVIESYEIRRSLMTRFPFVIYYRIIENNVVRITVVKHQRRHPSFGKNRK